VDTEEQSEEVDISEMIEENDTIDEIQEEVPPSFAELDENDFSSTNFKPINVVFVIDVSSSMRQEDRIELLKYSLGQLVEMLRPQDKIGLVSYANEAQVLLKPTSGNEKEKINEIVKELKASGLTAGGKGIKIGYRQARKNFISDGANKVIVITDGAFNRSSGDYEKHIKRNLKKCVTLSVVGIKSNERSEANMREAAQLGKGRFVDIEKLADAQSKLKQEIRLTAFKH
jgi:Ca-activated chloride channel family protein